MKRRLISLSAVAGFAILAFSLVSIAQPVTTGGGLSRVQVEGGGLEGSGTTSNKLRIRDDCGTGSGLTWDGDSWECGTVGGVSDGDKGDITVSSSGATWDVDSGAIGTTELADNLDLSSNGTTKTGNTLGAWISPSAITGTTNDWNPTGLSAARNIYVDLSGNATITGLQGGADGRELTICNSHATNILTFSNESGSSSAGNRIRMPGASSWKLYGSTYFGANGQPECGTFVYQGTLSRWIVKSWASQDMPSLEVLGTLYPATIAGAPNFTTSVTSTANWTLGNGTTDTVTVSGDLTVNDTSHLVGTVTIDGDMTLGASNLNNITVKGDLYTEDTAQFQAGAQLGNAESDLNHLYGKMYTRGLDPTVTSCGTSPSIVGNDKAGTVTTGGSTPSSCTLTFSGAYSTNAPICLVQRIMDPGTALNISTIATPSATSTSALTIGFFNSTTGASATCQGCAVQYRCVGVL